MARKVHGYMIGRLCRKNFIFGDSPSICIRAEHAKNSKTDVLPLLPELAKNLEEYFQEHPLLPQAQAFRGMWHRLGGAMLAEDLVGAGIEVKNTAGEVLDFHGLRHTCGTRLARSGVLPQVAMRIMRHSSMDLTLKHYTHLSLEDKATALARLPEISSPEAIALTGTHGEEENMAFELDRKMDRFWGQNGGILSHNESYLDVQDDEVVNVVNKNASP